MATVTFSHFTHCCLMKVKMKKGDYISYHLGHSEHMYVSTCTEYYKCMHLTPSSNTYVDACNYCWPLLITNNSLTRKKSLGKHIEVFWTWLLRRSIIFSLASLIFFLILGLSSKVLWFYLHWLTCITIQIGSQSNIFSVFTILKVLSV